MHVPMGIPIVGMYPWYPSHRYIPICLGMGQPQVWVWVSPLVPAGVPLQIPIDSCIDHSSSVPLSPVEQLPSLNLSPSPIPPYLVAVHTQIHRYSGHHLCYQDEATLDNLGCQTTKPTRRRAVERTNDR